MIRYLKNEEINFKKYDACVLSATRSKVYAFSWYLEAVTEAWDVLILDDYKAVMPLPLRKKYGINYIFQPNWIQHLGIFSLDPLSESDIGNFIKHIPKKFKLIDYNVNFKLKNSLALTNYIRPLNKDFKSIFKAFSKGRKSSITQAQKAGVEVGEVLDNQPIITLFKENKGLNLELTEDAYSQLEKLLTKAKELKKLNAIVAYSSEKELIGGAFFILSNNRITYLFSAVNQKGRDSQAMSLILNWVIKKYAESEYIFDFEGSMLPGVATFIKSFGAQKEVYYHLKKWRLL